MKRIVPLLLFFLVGLARAQDGEKTLFGRVTSLDKDVVGVVVQNITSRNAVITDLDGNFSIPIQLNDTLVFSAVNFIRKTVPVTDALYRSNFIEVPMQEFVNELKEVVVRPYNLSGDLNQDVGQLKLAKDVSAEALGLPNAHQRIPTQSERMLQTATYGKFNLGMILSPPLDPIINAITGRTKMLKNRVKVDKAYATTQQVQNSYADSLFTNTLKIPIEKIDDFMYFCEVDENFQTLVDSEDQLKIWDFMLEKSRVYRKNNNLD
ncbi:hypothetical protein [Flagellimonas beolgyonensis]|uniref:hypothetical protein n=1 Tax=Flagellimonas beolgyonensis TaxID=864064 RepID=UPI003D64E2ED